MLEELLQKIKFVLECKNEAQAERILEQFIFDQEEKTISFTNWVEDNYFPNGVVGLWHKDIKDNNPISTADLLDIFNRSN